MTVFLSHANEDRKLVELVFSRLTAEKAWYDAVEIANGDNIVKKISEGIQRASSFVVFWSKSAKESGWVEAEMGAGFINSLHGYSSFFIFQLDNTELPLIYRQFRAEKIDLSDIENAVNIITKSILENNGNSVRAPGLLDRYDEIKEIESAWLSGKK